MDMGQSGRSEDFQGLFNPYPVFFGTSNESDLWKKNPKSSLVTSQLGLRQ